MKSLPGRCTNEMFCTLGAAGRVIHVPDDQPFICPVCSRKLTTPAAPRRHWQRGAALFGLSVTLLIIAAFLMGLSIAGLPILRWSTDLVGWPVIHADGAAGQLPQAAGKPLPGEKGQTGAAATARDHIQ